MDRFSSDNWDDLRFFLAVARRGSLRGAAQSLGVNHATVTRHLSNLETDLATRLFDRRPEGFVATPAGEDLLQSAERIEEEMIAVGRRVGGRDTEPSGLIRISLPPALGHRLLLPDIVAFTRQHPQIELEVELTSAFSNLARREADVSIRMAREVDEDVVGRRLIQYAKAIYASPDYLNSVDRAAGDGPDGFAWIGYSDHERHPAWARNSPFPGAPVRHRLSALMLQLAAAKAGLGLSYLPCFLGDLEPGLIRAPGTSPMPDRSIWLLLHEDLRKTARVRAFVDFMATAILQHRAHFQGQTEATHNVR